MASVFTARHEVWQVVEPLLPEVVEQVGPGRRRVPDRTAFNMIVFVLVTGTAWRRVPRKLGCSGVTAWRRLRQAGVWERLHRTRRTGSKHHLLTDASGIPLAATLTAGSRNDVTQLLPSTGSGPSRAGSAAPASAPTSCSPIVATTTTSTAASSGVVASSPSSRAARQATGQASESVAGSSSEPSPG